MKSKILSGLLAFAALATATQSFALIDASLGIGQRNATLKNAGQDSDLKGIDTVLSAHVSPFPIPMVNIGLGLAVASTMWDKDDVGSQFVDGGLPGAEATEAQGLDVSLETMVSLSIPFLATPYAKLGYSVMNTQGMTVESDTGPTKIAVVQKGNGYNIGLGVKFSILPFISAMAEMSMFNGEYENDTYKVNGAAATATDSTTDVSSTTYLVGVEVDIGL